MNTLLQTMASRDVIDNPCSNVKSAKPASLGWGTDEWLHSTESYGMYR